MSKKFSSELDSLFESKDLILKSSKECDLYTITLSFISQKEKENFIGYMESVIEEYLKKRKVNISEVVKVGMKKIVSIKEKDLNECKIVLFKKLISEFYRRLDRVLKSRKYLCVKHKYGFFEFEGEIYSVKDFEIDDFQEGKLISLSNSDIVSLLNLSLKVDRRVNCRMSKFINWIKHEFIKPYKNVTECIYGDISVNYNECSIIKDSLRGRDNELNRGKYPLLRLSSLPKYMSKLEGSLIVKKCINSRYGDNEKYAEYFIVPPS